MSVLDNLVFSVNITVPIVLVLAVGFFLGRIGLIDKAFIKKANKLNFLVFLPCSVFTSLYCNRVDFSEGISVVAAEVIMIVLIFIIGQIISVSSTDEYSKRGTMLAGFLRSNYVYIGIPIICNICGITSTAMGSLVLAVIAIVGNILTPLGFSINTGKKTNIPELLKTTFLSPYIIASIIGIILMAFRCPQFPPVIHKGLTSLASICTPLALVTLGASFDFKHIGINKKLLVIGNVVKLAAFPLIAVPVLLLAGFRGESFTALYVFIACPTATLIYTLSQEMGGDTELASELVVTETVISMITMFAGTFILKMMGML